MDTTLTLGKYSFAGKRTTEIAVTNETLSYEELIGPVETQMMRSIWRIVRDPQEAEDQREAETTGSEVVMTSTSRLCRSHENRNPV